MVGITLTGEVSVSGRGRLLSERQLGGRRARLFLAVLVLERPRAVPIGELAEVIWPHGPPASWEPSLREVASKVRAALETIGLDGGEVVRGAFGCYQLRLPQRVEIDVEVARSRLCAGEQALRDGRHADAAELSEAAAAVATRPLLAGEEGAWVEAERARLRADLVRALEVVAAARLAGGEPQLAAAAAEQLVALEPFREVARVTLMRAQAAAGASAQALRTYEQWRRFLAEELGVDPSTEAQHFYHDLLAPATWEASTTTAVAPPPRVTRRLPGTLAAAERVPFVGRRLERELLRERVEAAAGGVGTVVLVRGEAGIGKTRLCARAAAQFDGTVLYGRCDPEPLAPFQPFVEALEGWVADAPTGVRERLLAEHGAALRRMLPRLTRTANADAPPPSRELERYRLVEAVAAVLEAAAPVMIVLDDIHWADSATLSLLPHLVRRITDARPLLVVATFRDDEPNNDLAHALAALRRDENVTRLLLRGLDESEVAELVAAFPRGSSGADTAALREQTGGNPFYLTQLLSDDISDGPSPRRDGAGSPVGVREVVADRVARLPPTVRTMLAAAAVVGSEFNLAIVARVTGQDGEEIRVAVDEAQDHGLVAPTGVADRYRFVHAIVRAGIYDQLTPGRRAGLHRRVAEALEAAGVAHHLGALAHHWGRGAPGDVRAVAAAQAAGEAAMAASAYEDAAKLFQQALDHLDGDDEAAAADQGVLLLRLGGALKRAGQASEAERVLLEAAEVARRLASADLLGQAALELAGHDRIAPPFNSAAFALVREAVAATDGEQSPRRVALLSRLATHLATAEPPEDLQVAGRQALAIAERLGGDAVRAEALNAHLHGLSAPEAAHQRLETADALAELADRLGHDEFALVALDHRISALVELGQMEAGWAAMELYRERARRTRLSHGQTFAAHHDCFRAVVEGRFDDAEQAVGRAVELVGPAGEVRRAGVRVMQLAPVRWLQGQLDELREEAEMVARWLPPPLAEPGLAFLAAETGREGEARHRLARFMGDDGLEAVPRNAMWSAVMFRLAAACARLRTAEHAGAVYDVLAPYAGMVCSQQGFVFFGAYDLHLGRLAGVEGRWELACSHLEAAVELHDAVGACPWTALTRHFLAEVLELRGRPVDRKRAQSLRADAAAAFEQLGLRPGLVGTS